MSDMLRGYRRRIEDWDDFAKWVSDALVTLTVADTFEIGLADCGWTNDDETEERPCVQAIALEDGALLFRRSLVTMGVPLLQSYSLDDIDVDTWRNEPLFEDCTDGFIVSRDARMLANVSVGWFRDSHRLAFDELGCEHYRAVSLIAPSPPPAEQDSLPDWQALSVAEQDAYLAEAMLRSGFTYTGNEDES